MNGDLENQTKSLFLWRNILLEYLFLERKFLKMGLITKEVEVVLANKMIQYYENLGYSIPRRKTRNHGMCIKRGTTIIVKTEDLPPNSEEIVMLCCDCCGKIYELKYKDYLKSLRDGKKYCHKCSIKLFASGENASGYNPNLTDEDRINKRNFPEYDDFVKRVYERDNYTCQCCGVKPKRGLIAHHLNGYNWYVEGRTDETNAVTLCENCHGNFHYQYGSGNNTREQYEEWIGCALGELTKYNGTLPTTRKVFCCEENKIYDSAKQYALLHDVTTEATNQACHHKKTWSLKGNHLFWYDEYMHMSIEDIEKVINHSSIKPVKVVCLTTGIIFASATDAIQKYGLKSVSGIIRVCKGERKSAGKLPDGTPLQWMYYEDFFKTSN